MFRKHERMDHKGKALNHNNNKGTDHSRTTDCTMTVESLAESRKIALKLENLGFYNCINY